MTNERLSAYNRNMQNQTDRIIEKLCVKAQFNILHDGQMFVENPLLGTKIAMPYGQTDLPRALKTMAANGLSVGGYTPEDLAESQAVVIDAEPVVDDSEHIVESLDVEEEHDDELFLGEQPEFSIQPTGKRSAWFDVVNSAGDIVSEKRLRKSEAIKLADEMNA